MNKQRMQQIVRAMVRTGYTDKQIAEELYIQKRRSAESGAKSD